MKKCTYCGREHADEMTVCMVDAQPLVPVRTTGGASQSTGGAAPSDPSSDPGENAQLAPEGTHEAAANKDMLVGGLWCIGGIIVTVATYSAAADSPTGGTYVVAWGAILFGAFQFIRGLSGESKAKARDSALEAQLLLDVAAKLESEDRARAVEKYEEIMRLFPNTAASREAQRNIQALTTRMQ